jgi:predicted DNA-binding protein (UPF0251 family)/predicted Fe-Mo cluster-binding NifX family protein
MPRKQRCRRIEGYPDHWEFSPEEVTDKEPVVMTLDEFETIRLLDREGMTQEQCAEKMGIARTTVTAIYESARRKIADAMVEGKQLQIRGGTYRLNDPGTENIIQKGTGTMRIGVTYENGEVFQHFGHTEQFKLYDVADGKIVSEQIVPTNGSGHGALAGFLKAAQVDALICGGIGMGAQNALAEAGIQLYGGVTGSADAAAKALAEGTLRYDPDARCDHHEGGHECGHHHEGGHACGHHHEGGHECGHHHGGDHECGHHHGESLDCGHQEGDEGCRRHHSDEKGI